MSPERFVDGLEARAADLLPEPVLRYLRQGAGDGVSASEATAAWDRFRLLPHVLRDVTDVQTGTSLLGTYVDTPLAAAPTTLQRAVHPDGEVAMARGVRGSGALMVLSSNAGSTLEDVAATPHDVEWVAQATGLPVVLKGVLRADDARRCVDAGAGAVWVSNHGGRQLDYAGATADCLAAVVAEVGSAAEVYVDGGVRCARHAVAALALGARGVFLGRLPVYALAADGSAACSGCSASSPTSSSRRSRWRAAPHWPGSPATCSYPRRPDTGVVYRVPRHALRPSPRPHNRR